MTNAVYVCYNDDPQQAHFFSTNNLGLSGEHFHTIGLFDTSFPLAASKDREFCDRWLCHGHQMTYAPEVVVYRAHVLTFWSFWRQHFKYGRGAFHVHQVRARRGWGRIKADPKF